MADSASECRSFEMEIYQLTLIQMTPNEILKWADDKTKFGWGQISAAADFAWGTWLNLVHTKHTQH